MCILLLMRSKNQFLLFTPCTANHHICDVCELKNGRAIDFRTKTVDETIIPGPLMRWKMPNVAVVAVAAAAMLLVTAETVLAAGGGGGGGGSGGVLWYLKYEHDVA
ncbi:uncharacterized protein LOC100569371 [Acyrthosiphon pisum]|uniref:Uncharacterized protein n=1 Tax=Acyrthosiphon pisum TaxID=7029 RepID=A0A8R2A9P7_ACYPI|nr:uncharacterized protein LOC100569371 [Acyrthosiphon pisum]|eukprot:XP_003246928.1 PREDICTED: uncharacterized protein LOC100569371 [Acyrthosiphon pisum]